MFQLEIVALLSPRMVLVMEMWAFQIRRLYGFWVTLFNCRIYGFFGFLCLFEFLCTLNTAQMI
ncbi:hypothetical protein HanIR_Chr11g0552681 [Helianthus annuus]|nr:hypothetical protein HanIR_Chr11g0552681 [Helianthus annuus]